MRWQVFGWEDEKYYHVGSPRMRLKDTPYHGDIFDTYAECYEECERLRRSDPMHLWCLMPKPVE